jgi:hypothetical protein
MPRSSRYCAYRRLTLSFRLPVSSEDQTTNAEGAFIFVLLPGKYSLTPARESFIVTMSKGKRRLRQRNRDRKKLHGTGSLPPVSAECVQCRRNSFSCVIYLVLIPINPPTHPRSFAHVHALIIEITLVILLILSCCTLVLPKMTSLLAEWQKWQTNARN